MNLDLLTVAVVVLGVILLGFAVLVVVMLVDMYRSMTRPEPKNPPTSEEGTP